MTQQQESALSLFQRLSREQEDEDQRARADSSLDAVTAPGMPSPDEAAAAQREGQVSGFIPGSGYDPAVVAARRRDRMALEGSPRLRAWLADPRNAAVAHDDVPSLSIWEGLQAAWQQGQRNIETARLWYRSNPEAVRLGVDRGAPNTGRLSAAERDRLKQLGLTPQYRSRNLLETVTEQLPQIFGAPDAGLHRAVRDFRSSWEEVYGTRERPLTVRNAVAAGVLLPTALVGGTLAAGGGFKRGLVGFVAQQEGGAAYQEFSQYRDQQGYALDPRIAGEYANRVGAINAMVEFAGLGGFAKATGLSEIVQRLASQPVRSALRRVALREVAGRAARELGGAALSEGLTELTQEGVTIGMGILARQAQGGEWEGLDANQVAQRMWDAFSVGATVGGVLGSVPVATRGYIDLRSVQQAQAQQELFDAINQGAEGSKLRGRAAGRYAAAVNAMVAGGPIETVRIDADRFAGYFQERGEDPLQVADKLEGVGRAALQQALDSGGEVVIPTGTYAARIAGTPAHADLAAFVRMGPDQMTPAEVQARLELGVDLERAGTEAAKLMAEATAKQAEQAAVRERIQEMFTRADAYTEQATAAFAEAFSAAITTLAERGRMRPSELLDRIQLSVRGPLEDLKGQAGALQQRGVSADGGPVRSDRYEAPEGVRFGASEKSHERTRKIVEMAMNGASNRWIAEELSTDEDRISANNIAVTLGKAAKKLGGAPWGESVQGAPGGINSRTGEVTATMEELMALRESLRKAGYTFARGASESGYKVMAERLAARGITMTVNALHQRFHKNKTTETGALNQFGGERSHSADLEALQRAAEMEDIGHTPEEIWKETGWWRSPLDGKWRYEIDDSKAEFITLPSRGRATGNLIDVLRFPQLFAAYPQLKDVKVEIRLKPDEATSSGHVQGNAIAVLAPDDASAMSVLLHEVQHVIQAIEGFAEGGSVSGAHDYVFEFMDELEKVRQEAINEHFGGDRARYDRSETVDPALFWQVEKMMQEEAAVRVYLRFGGEIEARNVQRRRGDSMARMAPAKRLTAEERKTTTPSASADMDISQGIIPFGSGAHLVALRSVAEESGSEVGRVLGEPPGARESGAGAAERSAGGKRSGAQGASAARSESRDFAARPGLDELASALAQNSQRAESDRLTALHNLSPENLIKAAELGGLAVPSIGIVPQGMGLQDIGGSITLIGRRDMADPASVPVYDADVWSPVFPRAEYDRISSKKIETSSFYRALNKWDARYGEKFRGAASALWDNTVNGAKPDDAINQLGRDSGAMAAFLESVGETPPEPPMREVPVSHRAPWARQPAWVAFVKDGQWERDNLAFGSDERVAFNREAGQAAKKAIAQYVNSKEFASARVSAEVRKSLRETFEESALNDDGSISYGLLHAARESAESAGKQEVDSGALREALETQIGERAAEFRQWIENEVRALFAAPFFRLKGKKTAFTLENVVSAMTGRVRAQEAGLTFGEGKARAAAAKKFSTLEQMRRAAAKQIRSVAEAEAAQDVTKKQAEEWRSALVKYYGPARNLSGRDSFGATWEAFDASMRALSKVMGGGKTAANMERALRREGFVDLPPSIVDDGVELAKALIQTPVPYFEAKPQRGILLNEFAGAVIPKSAPQQVRDILQEAGVPFREYENATRTAQADAAAAFASEMGQAQSDVLFQPARKGPSGNIVMRHLFEGGDLREAVISLFDQRDLSTPIHEGGHLFLEILHMLAMEPDANEQLKADWQTALDWFGMTSEQWEAADLEGKRQAHEQWARGFEAYVREGNAPSTALQRVFALFKRWLTYLYKSAEELGVTLTPEVRGVFSRLLASDEAIAEAQAAQGSAGRAAIMPREQFGGTDGQYERYVANIERAREEALATVQKQAIDALMADRTRWWRGEEAKTRRAVEIDIDSEPNRRAFDWLSMARWRHGAKPDGLAEMRLSPAAIVENYGQEMLDRLPSGLIKTDVDALAEQAAEVKRLLKTKEPTRLASWIQQQGGIRDPGGDVKAILGDGRARPGLINNASGIDPDEMAMRAWEAGYFGKGPGGALSQENDAGSVAKGPQPGIPDVALWHSPENVIEVLKGGEARRLMPKQQREALLRDVTEYVNARNRSWDHGLPPWRTALPRILEKNGISPDVLKPSPSAPGQGRAYHGSAAPLREVRPGLFVTEDFDTAARYTPRDARRTGGLDRVTPVDLNMQNPLVVDGDGAMLSSVLRGQSIEEFAQGAINNGHDGIVFRNVVDVPGDPRSANPVTVMYVTHPGTATPRAPYFTSGGNEMLDFLRRALTRIGLPVPFFQGGERPTVREFLDKLEGDLRNAPAYRMEDEELVARRAEAQALRNWFAERGVDIDAKPKELRAQIERIAAQTDREGVDPDLAASIFGFDSGQELLEALANLKPRREAIEEETRRRMLAAYGDPFANGSIMEEAMLAAHSAAQARVYEMELEAIDRATGGGVRPVSRAAKDIAEAQIERMSVRQIRGYDWFLGNERRHGKAAAEALADGDFDGARKAKYNQLVNFHLYALARKAAHELDVMQRHFVRLSERQGVRDNIDSDYLAQIDGLLEQYELRKITKKEEQRRISLSAWAQDMDQRGLGHMVAIDPAILNDARKRPFSQLDLNEARALNDAVRNIEHLGRLKERLLDAADKKAFREVVTGLADRMQQTGPISADVRKNYSPTAFERVQDRMREAHAEMTRMEFLFRYLDGGKANGPLWRALWLPFAKAADKESAMMHDATRALEQIWTDGGYSTRDRARLFKTRIAMPDLAIAGAQSFTRAELIAIALNLGNEGNVRALVDGFEWAKNQQARGLDVDYASAKQQIVAALSRVLEPRDWQTVQRIWNLIGTFRDEAFALQKDLTGLEPQAVKAEPLTLPDGTTLPGGYYPLKYDRKRDVRVERAEAAKDVQEMWGSNWSRPMTRKGHTIERVGSGGRPVKLSLAVLSEHVQNVVHDIAYRRAVIDVDRIITDTQFAEAFSEVAGRPMYDQLRPWLQSIASDRVDPSAFMWKFLQKLRGNVAIAAMGYRISTGLQQLTGLLQAVPMLGSGEMASALVKLVGRPDQIAAKAQFIRNRSEFMRSRMQTLDRDIRESLERMEKTDVLYPIRHNAFALVGMFDWAVSSVVWTAAFDKAMGGKVDGIEAGSEADAVTYADSAVRTTQSAGLPQDLPAIMRGNQVNKLLTMFFSYFSVLYNWSAYDQIMGVRKGQVPPHVFIANMALVFVIAPLIAEALAGRWEPRDDEDEDKRNKRLLSVVVRMPFQTIPVVRDIANVIGSSYEYQLSPAESGPAKIAQALNDAYEGRTFQSEATAKRAVTALGYAFGLPTPQAWTTIDYVADKIEGEEEGFDPVEAFVADRR